jgi:hypothetical protein
MGLRRPFETILGEIEARVSYRFRSVKGVILPRHADAQASPNLIGIHNDASVRNDFIEALCRIRVRSKRPEAGLLGYC